MNCFCRVKLKVNDTETVPLTVRSDRNIDFNSHEYIDIRHLSYEQILFNTKQGWAESGMISQENILYVVTDFKTIDGVTYAGFKVGDGLAYVVDLPCVEDVIFDHIENANIHVTSADKANWNNKVRCYNDGEILVFTTQ